MREISITFVLLCLGANLLFFLLRRWEAKEKPSPNYIPDYGLKAELKEQVSSVIAKYGVKATSRLSSALALPRVIRLFFDGNIRVRAYLHSSIDIVGDFLL